MAGTVLDLRGLRKSHGARPLFTGVDLSVLEGEKVGVIGRNGTGKTTLFRILAGEEGMDAGTLAIRRDLRIGYLPQDPYFQEGLTILETVAEGRGPLVQVLRGYEAVTQALTGNPDPTELERLLARQSALSTQIDTLGGWDLQHRVEEVLTRLGVSGWDRKIENLSGGERRRVALARTLLSDPELLLLDEPTNHLDAETVLWLEETLFDFPGTALIITHDRYFLDRVVDRMVEVTPEALLSFEGGYSDYLEARIEREARLEVEEAKRVKRIERELAWARRSPPARTGKQKARRARAHALAKEQREREGNRPRRVELEAAEAPRLGRTILELEGVTKAYDGRTVIHQLTDRLLSGERVGIVGPNGAGKSTLLRIIAGKEIPDSGTVRLGENTRLAWFDQERELDPELSVARAVSATDQVRIGDREMHLRAYLDRFLFPAHVHEQKVRALSGGERNRLLLARLFLESFNLLLLDEPTNDLDLDTLQVLEELLEEFGGCLLVVSHDRYFLDKMATSLLVFEAEGRVLRHHGSWDHYLGRREALRAEAEAQRREGERKARDQRAEVARTESREARGQAPRLSYKEQKELTELTRRIATLESGLAELEIRLSDPAALQAEAGGGALERLGREHTELRDALDEALIRWMELEERSGG
jgi:ABC transport system ATP-binding/permease protein